ncbi:LysR family transcriptional regulator [Duganella sp. FT80W]|uniref:LysR family transcriptional regulator n=1 Tax=Duganella guangzhouensis TaxID=2666084 RepID=A0A6I2L358_9BURK|nr:LysR substrate-binding domain-containing protein [Duganella guangzhouensis]MRW92232.1 LysR family transcriptional regulator [Duganella guangzhouensis]
MKHYQLRALVAVADNGSIRAAARALFLTQPAITKAIRDLENEIGLTLLVRQSRGVTLTHEGKMLLGRARMIVRELERAQEDIQALKGSAGGRLTIGVTPLAGLTVVPKAFALFREAWPEIELNFFEFTSDQLYDNLKNGMLDFAVGALPEERLNRLNSNTELISLPTSFAVRRDSPYATARSFAELQDVEWLHTDITGHFGLFISDIFRRHDLRPPKRITRCTSQALFYSLSMLTDVVIFWSRLSLEAPIVNRQFQALTLDEPLPDLKLNLMMREDGQLTRPAEYFISCIKQIAADEQRRLA